MNRDTLVFKTMLRVSAIMPNDLIRLIDQLEMETNVELIYKKILTFLKQKAKKEEDVKIVYQRLLKGLPSKNHEQALKLIEKEYPFVTA
jgi:hypothetical protein